MYASEGKMMLRMKQEPQPLEGGTPAGEDYVIPKIWTRLGFTRRRNKKLALRRAFSPRRPPFLSFFRLPSSRLADNFADVWHCFRALDDEKRVVHCTHIAMSDVVKLAPPPSMADMSPPASPKLEARKSSKAAKFAAKEKEEEPADANIPDNYVAYTLRNAKPRPPLSWNNILGELQYVSLAVLTITPTIAIVGSMHTPLKWQTAVFAVLYYFFTGLGITAGAYFAILPSVLG